MISNRANAKRPARLPNTGALQQTACSPGKSNVHRDLRKNPLVLTDSYNLSHQAMKVNTDWEVSHLYNRAQGQILFGFHEAIATFLADIKVTDALIDEAIETAEKVGMKFPTELWRKVVVECDGRVPLKVQALPEGSYCPAGTPFAQVFNTKKGFGELVTYWEAIFLHCHFSCGCATEAWNMQRYLATVRSRYNYPESFLKRFSSFGFRGHRSLEDAYWAGSAWALFLESADDFHISYHRPDAGLSSIPALAHKVVSQFDDENESFFRAIDYACKINAPRVALVIDTYDVYRVINHHVVSLAAYAKERGVDIILRPDSSDTWKQTVDIYDIVRENVLKNVSVIIGDSMSLENAKKADIFFQKHNVPLTFVSYGIGAGFYKHIDRDFLGHAMKTAFSNGKDRIKFSGDPIKRSIPGKVALFHDDNGDLCVGSHDEVSEGANLYADIYNDGTPSPIPSLTTISDIALAQVSTQHSVKISPRIVQAVGELQRKYGLHTPKE